MSEAKRNKDGIILPRVPKRIEAALAHLRDDGALLRR